MRRVTRVAMMVGQHKGIASGRVASSRGRTMRRAGFLFLVAGFRALSVVTGRSTLQRIDAARDYISTRRNAPSRVVLSLEPGNTNAWRGLIAVRRRWAGGDSAKLRRDADANRLAIRRGMDGE